MINLVNVYQAGRIVEGAVEFLYKLLNERPPEANISHRELPTLERHRAFVLRRPYRAWYLIAAEPQAPRDDGFGGKLAFEPVWVGTVSLTSRNEIGVAVLREYQRRGYARAAVLQLMAEVSPLDPVPGLRAGRYIANVAPGNEASHALFEGMGAKLVQLTYEF